MKDSIKFKLQNSRLPHLFMAGCLSFLFMLPLSLAAQTDSTKKTEEPAAKEESGLISPAIEFVCVQKADNTIDLKTALKAKVKGSFIKLPHLKISFKLVTDTAENDLGSVITDRVGKAVLNVKAGALMMDKEGKLHFKAVFAGNKAMETAEEELTIQKARLVITAAKEDSLLMVHAKLVDMSTGTETAVPEATIGLFVKRQFFPLKIGEGTTDENGEAAIEVPVNLPGDAKGNITLTGRLDENEKYGNLEATVIQKWGVAVSDKSQELPRALWSTHPPVWMLITFIILMTTVWGHYIVIIFELFRLRKEEPKTIPA